MENPAEGEQAVLNPNFALAQRLYEYESTQRFSESKHGVVDIPDDIRDMIQNESMAPYYKMVCTKYSWHFDEAFYEQMSGENEKKFAEIERKLEDAIERAGDMEILDAIFEKAKLFSAIGDFPASLKVYDDIISREKTGTGRKIDAWMAKARIALFDVSMSSLKEYIAESKRLVELGGDWDRRNRLKVYEALYLITRRDIHAAAELLLECVATFSCTELCSYKTFMFYTIITNIMSLPRSKLEKSLVRNSNVISVMRELPDTKQLLLSIYNCDYHTFFAELGNAYEQISRDRYLGLHSTYIIREFRVLAYSQFLEAYRSVLLSSMATSFGLSSIVLDQELSRFISSGRLHAKIDKVGDVVENCRPDKKNAQYQEIIKKGDVLLNSVQKLGKYFGLFLIVIFNYILSIF